jgi:hypothetical protein
MQMSNVITLDEHHATELPARGVMTAAQRREHQRAKPVWNGNLAMGFLNMWRGRGVSVTKVDKQPAPLQLPRHLRPAVVTRTSRARVATIQVSGNQSAIKPVEKQLTKAQKNAAKSTARANRQAREKHII